MLFTDGSIVSLYNYNGYAWDFCRVVRRLVDCCTQGTDRVVKGEPGLKIEYRTRPVLRVPVGEPVCQNAAATAIIRSLGHWSECNERYTAATKRTCTVPTKTWCPVHLVSSIMILDTERKRFCPMTRRQRRSSFHVTFFNRGPRSP